jgi:hypothetical protein
MFREAYIDALAKASVIINQNPQQGAGLLNMRYWEAQAADAIVMTEKRDAQANYDAGLRYTHNVLTYRSVDDIISFADELLSVEKKSVVTGQEMIFRHHTYENRCQRMLEVLFPHEA